MKTKKLFLAALAALGICVVATPVLAQGPRAAGDGLRMPWQSGFWGYAGINVGVSQYDFGCGPFSCDRDAGTAKIYFGGRFNNIFGLEVGYVNMGEADFASGHVEAQGLNLSLLAGFPIGTNSSIFGKIGTTAGHTKVSDTVPGIARGTENDWGLSYGIGGQIGLSPNWALRLDADRYRFKFVGGNTDDVDTLTVGLQYTFR